MSPGPTNEEVAQFLLKFELHKKFIDLTLPSPAFLSSLWNGQGPISPGDALSYTRCGPCVLPRQAMQEALHRRLALQFSLPVDVLGTASPLFVPLIPSAQQLPKFNSGVECLQPPVAHCLLGITPIPPNKGPQIWISLLTLAWHGRMLSRTVPMLTSLKPFSFADLCLTSFCNAVPCHCQTRCHISYWT